MNQSMCEIKKTRKSTLPTSSTFCHTGPCFVMCATATFFNLQLESAWIGWQVTVCSLKLDFKLTASFSNLRRTYHLAVSRLASNTPFWRGAHHTTQLLFWDPLTDPLTDNRHNRLGTEWQVHHGIF